MQIEERLDRLRHLLELHGDRFDTARIRCVASEEEGGVWANLRCDIVLAPRESKRPEKVPSLKYPGLVLLEEWCEPEAIPDLAAKAHAGAATIDGTTVKFGKLTDESALVREAVPPLLFGCPVYRVVFPFSATCPVETRKLISTEHAYFPNEAMAILAWCQNHGLGNMRTQGAILVHIPQCRARFDSLLPGEGEVAVTLLGDESTLAGAMIVGAFFSPARLPHDVHLGSLRPGVPCKIPVPADAAAAHLHLVDASGEILDQHLEGGGENPWRPRILPDLGRVTTDEAAVREAIDTGESLHVEFKPYIRPGDGKMRELCQTVVAFANTEGGIVILGLTDLADIVGIEKEVAKASKKSRGATDDTSGYVAEVKKAIRELVHPAPEARVELVELASHTLVAIFVSAGTERPYAMSDNHAIFVRRSASNAHPNPDQLRTLLSNDSGRGGSQ